MSKAPAYSMTNETINVVWDGKSHTIRKGTPNFLGLRTAIINEDWDSIPKYLTIAKSIQEWAKGAFTVRGEIILYDKEPLPTDLNQRILDMVAASLDPKPFFLFWERLQKNPSWRSVQQLFPFLKHQGVPLTEDGCFLAYKGVNADYTDKYTSTVSNKPGTVNKMPRNKISDDPKQACHYGYHVGAFNYASGFKGSDGKLVICKVDPEHVVCVPYDESQQKMRVCEYTVIGNYGTELPSTVYIEEDRNKNDTSHVDEIEEEVTEHVDLSGAEEKDDPNYDPEEDPLTDKNMGLEPSDDDDDEDEVVEAKSLDDAVKSVAEPKKKVPVEEGTKKPLKKKFDKFNNMDSDELLEQSLDDLRRYATYGLDIIGASKIPGGKVALIARIIETRDGN